MSPRHKISYRRSKVPSHKYSLCQDEFVYIIYALDNIDMQQIVVEKVDQKQTKKHHTKTKPRTQM